MMVVGRQCTKPDVLIPLKYIPSKLLLVGDPKQLPSSHLKRKIGWLSLNLGMVVVVVVGWGG